MTQGPHKGRLLFMGVHNACEHLSLLAACCVQI